MIKNVFSRYHPLVIFLYFAAAAGLSMAVMNPAYVALSFVCGSLYKIYLSSLKSYLKSLLWLGSVWAAIAAVNALTNPLGLTLLFKAGGRPVTLEALIYGATSGGMMISVILWFSCYSEVMTSDKFLSLFGRLVPKTAMMTAMVLKYIPETIKRYRQINEARSACFYLSENKTSGKIKNAFRTATVLMEWSMEASIITADSMKCRGYGLNRRSVYTNERIKRRDITATAALFALIAASAPGAFKAALQTYFYPFVKLPEISAGFVFAAAVLLFPFIVQLKEVFSCRRRLFR